MCRTTERIVCSGYPVLEKAKKEHEHARMDPLFCATPALALFARFVLVGLL